MDLTQILGIIIIVLIVWLILTFNRLIVLRNRKKEALSDIDVQSKRRYDLIPNLIETVKGYAAHEKGVLEGVTKARTDAMNAQGNQLEKAETENQLSQTLKSLFALSENYPDLKANANFLELQRELSDTENKMMASRRFFNSTVTDLNNKIEKFPTNLIAGSMGFHKEEFFKTTTEAESQPVQVKF
jgi:LemA protein